MDDSAIATYLVYQADIVIARVPARQTTYVASGLIEGAQYTFGVVAEDTAGNRSPQLSLTLQTRDQSPPIWTDNAVLRAVDVTETHATLTWPEAQDNAAVARYRVILDDRIALETAATTAQLQNLSALTTYRAQVVAIDGSNHPSVRNPTVQFTTIDKTPPEFAAGATLVLHDASPCQVTVSWQAAIDNGTISGYEVSLDGAQLGRTDAHTRTYTVLGLQAGTQATVSVKASMQLEI